MLDLTNEDDGRLVADVVNFTEILDPQTYTPGEIVNLTNFQAIPHHWEVLGMPDHRGVVEYAEVVQSDDDEKDSTN